VEDETEYIKNYIKIMNYRFAGRFQYCVNIPEELMQLHIIRFVLQPVVENAISHGLINKIKGEINITAWKQDQILWVQVEDDGEGISDSVLGEIRRALNNAEAACKKDSQGIGLSNVNRRIKLHFGNEYGLEIYSSIGQGTRVVFKMPVITDR
jgi:sensor histidine kinase YesM